MLLALIGGNNHIVWPATIGIAIAIPALAGFYLVQSEFGHSLFKRILTWIIGDREWSAFGTFDDLFAQLNMFYSSRAALARSSLLHFADWFVGSAEVWIILSFMGYPVTVVEAVIIESLLHAVRGAAFAVPGALGAQEGGLIVLCAIFGVPPEVALALSLVKRIPDIIIGVPGLIAWQVMEGWHFRGARGRPSDNRNERA
jgi:putative membrane protein